MTTKDVPSKLTEFFSKYPARIYNKGDVLVQAGEKPPVYFITKGVILQYDIAENGDKLILNTYKPAAFIPLASILNDIPSEFFFEATDYVTVHVAPSGDVATFLKNNPDVAYDALARVSRGSNGMMLRLARAMEGGAEGRILQELSIMRARFADTDGVISVTDSELAAQTGMARETISRCMKKLASKGLLTAHHGKVIIHDTHHI